MNRIPQSEQSIPRMHVLNSEPSPPSSHVPSEVYDTCELYLVKTEHASKQRRSLGGAGGGGEGGGHVGGLDGGGSVGGDGTPGGG